jgi:hypothetical protein
MHTYASALVCTPTTTGLPYALCLVPCALCLRSGCTPTTTTGLPYALCLMPYVVCLRSSVYTYYYYRGVLLRIRNTLWVLESLVLNILGWQMTKYTEMSNASSMHTITLKIKRALREPLRELWEGLKRALRDEQCLKYAHTHTHTHTHTQTHKHMYVCMYVCMYIYVFACVSINIYIRSAYVNTYTYLCVYVYMAMYMYMYACMYIHKKRLLFFFYFQCWY